MVTLEHTIIRHAPLCTLAEGSAHWNTLRDNMDSFSYHCGSNDSFLRKLTGCLTKWPCTELSLSGPKAAVDARLNRSTVFIASWIEVGKTVSKMRVLASAVFLQISWYTRSQTCRYSTGSHNSELNINCSAPGLEWKYHLLGGQDVVATDCHQIREPEQLCVRVPHPQVVHEFVGLERFAVHCNVNLIMAHNQHCGRALACKPFLRRPAQSVQSRCLLHPPNQSWCWVQ